MQKISLLGTGWLGLPLAHRLAGRYAVKVSATSEAKRKVLEESGLSACEIRLGPAPEGPELTAFLEADVLIFSLPPRSRQPDRDPDFYPDCLRLLLPFLENSPVKELIFTSSTAVYPPENREMSENDARPAVRPDLSRAEDFALSGRSFRTTVLRLSGLSGGSRLPGLHFAGKTDLPGGSLAVNQVHREDVIRIIEQIISGRHFGGIYNVSAPVHPSKSVLYTLNARKAGRPEPVFLPDNPAETGKIISSEKLIRQLNYEFLYPDPCEFPTD